MMKTKKTRPSGRSRLLPEHRDLLRSSSIDPGVSARRGYRSVRTPDTLRRLGFNKAQCELVPAMVISLWDMNGENKRFQIRPDAPRLDHRSGKPRKYENLPGVGVRLDVHPDIRKDVRQPFKPLYITEGVRKADAAISQGLCCIALLGVYNWRGTDQSGALKVLPDWEEIPVKGRAVYIVFDSDVETNRSVQQALGRIFRWLSSKRAIVNAVYLPSGPDGAKQGLDDWLAAGNLASHLERLAEDKLRGLPEVVMGGRHQRDLVHDAVSALEAANNPPQVYRSAQTLVRVRLDERDRPYIQPYSPVALKGRLAEVADFCRVRDSKRIPTSPTKELAEDILAMQEWSFPVLESVVETPTVQPGGKILDKPGYDPVTRMCYVPAPDFELPDIPDDPSAKWVEASRKMLMEVFHDFPFVDDASRANAIGLLITPIIHPALDGLVPLALIDAPQAGTGKSLIADALSMLTIGSYAEMMSPHDNEEEWRKQITTALLRGSKLIVIDNLMGMVRSASLSRALTAKIWKDRFLGQNRDVVVPQQATWVATGNNIILGGDLPRRAYSIRIDAKSSRPWLRSSDEFLHPRLVKWIEEQRPLLLTAVLTLVRAWYSVGCPRGDVELQSYVEWSSAVGGILKVAGIDGFLGNLEDLYEVMDPGEGQWESFLKAWHDSFGLKPLTSKDIYLYGTPGYPFDGVLPDELAGERSTKRIGWALGVRRERRYGKDQYYLASRKDKHAGSQVWRVYKGRKDA